MTPRSTSASVTAPWGSRAACSNIEPLVDERFQGGLPGEAPDFLDHPDLAEQDRPLLSPTARMALDDLGLAKPDAAAEREQEGGESTRPPRGLRTHCRS